MCLKPSRQSQIKQYFDIAVHVWRLTTHVRAHAQMFDGNVAENLEPLALVVGNGNVLEGLEIGLLGMRVNGMRRLVVPPSLVS